MLAIGRPPRKLAEVSALGMEILRNRIEPGLAPTDRGKYVAVELDSGAYEMDEDDTAAMQRLRARCPSGDIFLGQIGHDSTYRIR